MQAIEVYNRAQRLGMRDYREKTAAGKYPYLPALDELLEKTDTESQIPLGTIEIPLDYVVGTKTTGRTMAFASNFMPLLDLKTEFASKWVNLCLSHLEEGIRDPIRCPKTLSLPASGFPCAWPIWKRASTMPLKRMSTWAAFMSKRATNVSVC